MLCGGHLPLAVGQTALRTEGMVLASHLELGGMKSFC